MSAGVTRLIALAAACGLCAAAWGLPGEKQGAVLGRYDYTQACLVVLSSTVLVSMLLLAGCRWRRRVIFRVTAVWLAAGLCLGAIELWAYAWPTAGLRDNPWYIKTGRGIARDTDLPFVRPPHLHWRGRSRGDLAMRPGDYDPYAPMVTFATDHQGFRNSSDIKQAQLVFIGDSFTEAGNVDEAQTFVQRVAAEAGLTVRNLGRAGYSPPMELVVLNEYALPMKPRTVVWQIAESNDLAESALYARWLAAGRPAYHITVEDDLSRRDAWRRRSPTRRLFDQWREVEPWPLSGTLAIADGGEVPMRFLAVPDNRHLPGGHEGWPVLTRALADGAALCRDHDIRLIVLFVPMKIRAVGPAVRWSDDAEALLADDWLTSGPQTFGSQLAAACAALDIHYVDATDAITRAARAGEVVYWPFDTHLAPAGHAVVAQLLTPMLE